MILVRTDWPDFKAYLAALSKPARKNFKAIARMYHGTFYGEVIRFDIDEVRGFMRLWETQLVRGVNPQWAFPVETVEEWWAKGQLKLFAAYGKHGDKIGMQFIQKRDGYWECHPPMYDKVKHESLAKYMWFMLIGYAILRKFDHLDLGGMSDDWRHNLHNWREYKHQYKWAFVPKKAKDDPESEPHYYIGKPLCSLRLKD